MKSREEERDRLRRQLAHADVTGRRAEMTPTRLRDELAARFADWRIVLRRHPQVTRQIVKKLIDGPIRFTPKRDRDGTGYVEFEAEGTLTKMLGNLSPILVASPTPASWDQIASWLKQIDNFRQAACALAGPPPMPHSNGMSPSRARVEKGRLILGEPTTLPEGTVIDLVADDEGDNLTDEERRALHAALSESWASAEAGRLRPASEILDELRQRR